MTVVLLRLILVLAVISLASCSGLPKLSLTPISVDSTIGGEHQTQQDEDNMVKVQTGDTTNANYVADKVDQVYNDIQEYPLWLVLAFAFAVGMALPSPVSAWGSYQRRKELKKQIDTLTKALSKSAPHPTSDMETT